MLERSVPGLLSIGREATSGQLPASQVIANALATDSLALAGFITAVTGTQILFLIALHDRLL